MLYIRMAVIMLVTLYISRLVLAELGETDFGIYNIVGSVVVSLVFIQNTLMSATQRFLSYEIGIGDVQSIRRVFSMSLNIHWLFILIVVAFLETLGLWFLNNMLSIPDERMFAANVAYQASIATFALNMLRIPYNSIIVSYEKMDIYALLSIVEALLKLSTAYFLIVISSDKLIVYAILVLIITLIINLFYMVYCKKTYKKVTHYVYEKDKALFKRMLGFSGWNMVGGVTGIATAEGPNYLMNIYLGVGVNAAMGLAKQVSSAVYQFTANFQQAFNPQIVKAYASGQKDYLTNLIHNTSLLSFYLIFIVAFPLILGADLVFDLWLVEVPEYAVEFSVLIMIAQLFSALSSPMWMVVHATGNIRTYQLVLTAINLLIIPASWIILALGYTPVYVICLQIFISLVVFIYRLYYLGRHLNFDITYFCKNVIRRCSLLVLIIIPIPIMIRIYGSSVISIITSMVTAIIISVIAIMFWGINKDMRSRIISIVKNKIHI